MAETNKYENPIYYFYNSKFDTLLETEFWVLLHI